MAKNHTNLKMQVTTGIDIIEVQRIQEAIEKTEGFLDKIYTVKEIQYCRKSKGDLMYQHFAARFAAKEAVFKAISTHIQGREDALWKDIEIVDNLSGKPEINVDNLRAKRYRRSREHRYKYFSH